MSFTPIVKTKEDKEYWAFIDRVAKEADQQPKWMDFECWWLDKHKKESK